MTDPNLEPHQQEAVAFLVIRKWALIQSPAGSGKTFMAAAALQRVLAAKQREGKVRVGWIANTIEQLDQGRAALAAFSGVMEAIDLTIECPAGIPEGVEWDLLIVDEAHHGTAPTWMEIIAAHRGALWMFTATPFGEDEDRNEALRAMVKGQIHVVPRSAVAARVLHGVVKMLDDTDPVEEVKPKIDAAIAEALMPMARRYAYATGMDLDAARNFMWPKVAFRMCLNIGVAANCARNSAILRLARKHEGDSLLILVNSVAHGESLATEIPGAVVCHSKMGKKKRAAAMVDFSEGTLRCMIATSLADEGLNLPRANVLILAGAGRSSAKVEQRTGRVLRTFGEKTHGLIYDFEDKQHPLLASQSRKRQAVYRALGYTVEKADQLALFRH